MTEGAPVTILLVEDDPAHAEIVRRTLAEARIANRVILLPDGQAALDHLLGTGGGPRLASSEPPPRGISSRGKERRGVDPHTL
jgi:hypothetical protein